MRIVLALAFALFLLSCASRYAVVDIPQFSQKSFSVSAPNQSYILSVARLKAGFKFILIDSFGAPISRRFLSENKFKNVGFLPPNGRYDELFIKVLELIKNGEKSGDIALFGDKFFIRQLDDISI